MADRPDRSWGFLAGAYLAMLGLATGWFLVLYGPLGDWTRQLDDTHGGAILAELVNLLFWAQVIVVLARRGGYTARNLGLERSKVPPALVTTAGLWVLAQGVEMATAAVAGDSLEVRLTLLTRDHGVVPFLIGWVAVALGEETFFRGFLQGGLVYRTRRAVAAPLGAIVLASAAFSVAHLPRQVFTDEAILSRLAILFALGLVLGAVYQATGNLFVAVGVHALLNWPLLAFEETLESTIVVAALAAALAGAAAMRRPAVFTERPPRP